MEIHGGGLCPAGRLPADNDDGDSNYSVPTFGGNEVKSLVDVGNLVEAHLAAVGLGQGLPGDDLEKQHQLQAIAEVFLDVLDASAGFPQVAVAPCCESLETEKREV